MCDILRINHLTPKIVQIEKIFEGEGSDRKRKAIKTMRSPIFDKYKSSNQHRRANSSLEKIHRTNRKKEKQTQIGGEHYSMTLETEDKPYQTNQNNLENKLSFGGVLSYIGKRDISPNHQKGQNLLKQIMHKNRQSHISENPFDN